MIGLGLQGLANLWVRFAIGSNVRAWALQLLTQCDLLVTHACSQVELTVTHLLACCWPKLVSGGQLTRTHGHSRAR